ncbi:hypothetical protein [Mycoplasma buteonis]|uniref:hypothetical protein n=1 Tax=Mycoplasma buteonis TaxID=171280 RepID=UPI00056B78B3|nr:hypothetical protein [Mycoplasma buteonis]
MKFKNKIHSLLFSSLAALSTPLVILSAACGNTDKTVQNNDKQNDTTQNVDVQNTNDSNTQNGDTKQPETTTPSEPVQNNPEQPVDNVSNDETNPAGTTDNPNDQNTGTANTDSTVDTREVFELQENLVNKFMQIEFFDEVETIKTARGLFNAKFQNASTQSQKEALIRDFHEKLLKIQNAYNKTNILQSIKKEIKYIQSLYVKTWWFSNPLKERAYKLLTTITIKPTDTSVEAASTLLTVLALKNDYKKLEAKFNKYLDLIQTRNALVALYARLSDSVVSKLDQEQQKKANKFKEDYNTIVRTKTVKNGKNVYSYKVLFSNSIEEMEANIVEMKAFTAQALVDVVPSVVKTMKNLMLTNSKKAEYKLGYYAEYKKLLDEGANLQLSSQPTEAEIKAVFDKYVEANNKKTDIENELFAISGKVKEALPQRAFTLSINVRSLEDQLSAGEELVWLYKSKLSDGSTPEKLFVSSLAPELPIAYQTEEGLLQYNKFKDLRALILKDLFVLNNDSFTNTKFYETKGSEAANGTKILVTYLMNSIDFAIQVGIMNDTVYNFLRGYAEQTQFSFPTIPYFSYTYDKSVLDREVGTGSSRPTVVVHTKFNLISNFADFSLLLIKKSRLISQKTL